MRQSAAAMKGLTLVTLTVSRATSSRRRRRKRRDAMIFFISGITTLAYLTAAPLLAVLPPAEHWPFILFGAALSFASLLLLAWAYARAEAQHLAPVEYTSFIWAALLGWFAFGEEVSGFTLAGAALIVGACLIAASRREPDLVVRAEAGIAGGA